ncbi:MAG: hypothetical protein GXO77_15165, partial [Calditrichaeota bacterium]|nr:hypothetical protein [Calditrichota bacterium]
MNIGFVISSHGYGHAARSCAVMKKLRQQISDVHFVIFTGAPEWFFRDSLPESSFTYISAFTDVGMIQRSPFEEDIEATLSALKDHLPFNDYLIEPMADQLAKKACRFVVCDISAAGILAAKRANLPAVLIENFTWDWIYDFYSRSHPQFEFFAAYLKEIYRKADYHIQAVPFTKRKAGAFRVPPISREPKHTRSQIRKSLNIPTDAPAVLISTGGIPVRHNFPDRLKKLNSVYFIIPHDVNEYRFEDNLIVLPHHSEFYHPDLVLASDAVVCKSGYSTIAEAYRLSKPVVLVKRPSFPESPSIEQFVKDNFHCRMIDPQCFIEGGWIKQISELLKSSSSEGEEGRENGA